MFEYLNVNECRRGVNIKIGARKATFIERNVDRNEIPLRT